MVAEDARTPFERNGFVRVFVLWAVYAAVMTILAAAFGDVGLAILMLVIGAVTAQAAVFAAGDDKLED